MESYHSFLRLFEFSFHLPRIPDPMNWVGLRSPTKPRKRFSTAVTRRAYVAGFSEGFCLVSALQRLTQTSQTTKDLRMRLTYTMALAAVLAFAVSCGGSSNPTEPSNNAATISIVGQN